MGQVFNVKLISKDLLSKDEALALFEKYLKMLKALSLEQMA